MSRPTPAPRVYGLAAEALGIDSGGIVFVSGNAWDAAGAASVGLRAVLIDAAGAPAERLPAAPSVTIVRSGTCQEFSK